MENITDSTTNEYVLTVKLTKKGSENLIELLQNIIGYIEEDLHEQIINSVQTWMNENYRDLIEFYIKAVEHGLVPANLVKEQAFVIEQLKKKIIELDPFYFTSKRSKSNKEESENFKDITTMNIWQLKKLAKKMDIKTDRKSTKRDLLEKIKEKIKQS